jgi:hypothetical protein
VHVTLTVEHELSFSIMLSEAMAAPTIPIPTELRRPHPFVSATRQAASGLRLLEDGRLKVGGTEGVVWMTVTREQLRRALLVAQAIFKEAETRGDAVEAIAGKGYGRHAGVAVVIRGHAYAIEITELQDRIPLTDEELADWDRQEARRHYYSWEKRPERPTHKKAPNGYLRVSLPSCWNGARNNSSEGPRGLMERRLPTLFEELERRAEDDDRRAEEWAREREHRRLLELTRAERERLQRIEKARVSRLSTEISAWRLATTAREYASTLRARLAELSELSSDDRTCVEAWCDWIDEWSRRSDPALNVSRIHGLDDEHDQYSSLC